MTEDTKPNEITVNGITYVGPFQETSENRRGETVFFIADETGREVLPHIIIEILERYAAQSLELAAAKTLAETVDTYLHHPAVGRKEGERLLLQLSDSLATYQKVRTT